MSKINIKNMPQGILFEFGKDNYIWKISRPGGTRDGNYLTSMNEEHEYTEVFKLQNNGRLAFVWGGRLVSNPGLYGEDGLDSKGCFNIFSYDEDCGTRFHQDKELTEAKEELQQQVLEQEQRVVENIREQIEKSKGRSR